MFQNNSAFDQEVERLRESIRQFEQGKLDLTPAPKSPEVSAGYRQAKGEELNFYLDEAAFSIERLASVVPGEYQGELADVVAYIEEARNTVNKLDL